MVWWVSTFDLDGLEGPHQPLTMGVACGMAFVGDMVMDVLHLHESGKLAGKEDGIRVRDEFLRCSMGKKNLFQKPDQCPCIGLI